MGPCFRSDQYVGFAGVETSPWPTGQPPRNILKLQKISFYSFDDLHDDLLLLLLVIHHLHNQEGPSHDRSKFRSIEMLETLEKTQTQKRVQKKLCLIF